MAVVGVGTTCSTWIFRGLMGSRMTGAVTTVVPSKSGALTTGQMLSVTLASVAGAASDRLASELSSEGRAAAGRSAVVGGASCRLRAAEAVLRVSSRQRLKDQQDAALTCTRAQALQLAATESSDRASCK